MAFTRVLLVALVPLAAALHVPHSQGSTALKLNDALRVSGLARGAGQSNLALKTATASPSTVNALRGGGETPLLGCIGSLIKNIVGSGVLALAGAVAAFSDEPSAVYPAMAIALVAGLMSAYCFALVGRTCEMTKALTYRDAWVKTVGEGSAWLPAFTCTWKTAVACLCYSIIIGDLSRDLASSAGLKGSLANRELLLTIVSITVVLPLCLLRKFDFLQYTSLLGISGTVFTALFMVLRKYQGAYDKGGKYSKEAPEAPVFSKKGTSAIKALILVSTLTTNYLAHYNAPKFLKELKDPTIDRFNVLTYSSFLGAFALSAIFMASGFLTFGGASKGLVLNNYASSDGLATASRFGIAASIIFGYPLTFVGFRDGLLELVGNKTPDQATKDQITVVAIAVLTGLAMVLRDLGVVVSFFGALLGSAVIYVYPAIMFLRALQAKGITGTEYYAQYGIIGAGTLLGAVGAVVVILKTYTNVLK